MPVLNTSENLLHHLTYRARLTVTGAAFLLCLGLYASGYIFTHEGSILALPVALAAWMFRRYEPWICVGCTILAVAIINTLAFRSALWPRDLILAFFASSLILLAEVLFIRFLRHIVDAKEVARQKAMEAEQQLSVVYEQQRELNQLKDQFILNVNHELRTHLTELQGYLELLRDHSSEIDGDGHHASSQVCITVKDAGFGIPPRKFHYSLRNLYASNVTSLARNEDVVWGSTSTNNWWREWEGVSG